MSETALATIEAPEDLRQNVAACVEWSTKNLIVTPVHYEATAEHLKTIKTRLKQADEFFDGPIKSAYDLHKTLCGRKQLVTNPLKQAESIDKAKQLQYIEAQKKKAEDERRRLQAIADEEARKQKAKIDAAAEVARQAEQAAREKAEALRKQAEEATDAEKKRLLALAETQERKADAQVAKQEVAAESAAAVFAPVINVEASVPRVKGQSIKETWQVQGIDLAQFYDYVVENKRWDLIQPNTKVLEGLAKNLKSECKIPGVVVGVNKTLSSTGR